MSEAARSRRVEPGFEPPFERPSPRAEGSGRPGGADPLAELARLVGHNDPFHNIFKPAPTPGPEGARRLPEEARPDRDRAAFGDVDPVTAASQEIDLPLHDEAAYAMAPHDEAALIATESQGEAPAGAEDLYYAHPEEMASAYEAADESLHAVEPGTAPEMWADEPLAVPPGHPLSDESAASLQAPRKPLVVLFAVLALTLGGLGATFLSRSGASIAATGGRDAPTIMASSVPTKIQQVPPSTATNAEDAESALLNRNGEAKGGGPVKVVQSQEQPTDLAQLPKPSDPSPEADAGVRPAMSQSPFPEPRKVKTFVVRADGSMISTSVASALAPQGSRGLPPLSALPPAAAPAAVPEPQAVLPATPRTASRGATTPKAMPPANADTAADATNSVPAKPRQPASPGPKPVAKAKPIDVASASPADAPAAQPASGSFALQLAASPSERDAREAFVRLQKQYSDLGSYQPRIKKAGTPDKPVYRLRVGSMSQDEAKTLCSTLQASGGSCFVVRN